MPHMFVMPHLSDCRSGPRLCRCGRREMVGPPTHSWVCGCRSWFQAGCLIDGSNRKLRMFKSAHFGGHRFSFVISEKDAIWIIQLTISAPSAIYFMHSIFGILHLFFLKRANPQMESTYVKMKIKQKWNVNKTKFLGQNGTLGTSTSTALRKFGQSQQIFAIKLKKTGKKNQKLLQYFGITKEDHKK